MVDLTVKMKNENQERNPHEKRVPYVLSLLAFGILIGNEISQSSQ